MLRKLVEINLSPILPEYETHNQNMPFHKNSFPDHMEKLRPDELESFKEAFEMFDKNADGTISTKVRSKLVPK